MSEATKRPQSPRIQWDDIPDELRKGKFFVPWRYEFVNRAWTKVLLNANKPSTRGASTRPETWGTFDAVRSIVEEAGSIDGIGRVVTADDPFAGLDVDACRDAETGELNWIAQQAVDALHSYTEVTPSERGIRVWVQAPGFTSPRKKFPSLHVELYTSGRFFTLTGVSLNGDHVETRPHELEDLWAMMPDLEADQKILKRARSRSPRFGALYDDGDISAHDSPSEADWDLCCQLAQYTNDPAQIKRLFLSSALTRPKVTEREDYLERTIANAIEEASAGDFEEQVQEEMQRQRVRQEARMRIQAEDTSSFAFPDLSPSLAEELEMPDEDEIYRIDQLHPAGGNVLLVARHKSGKTALTLNLARSLADGTPFLGRFEVEPLDGRIAVFNYEETPPQWRRHIRALGIENADMIVPLHMRGEGRTPIWEPSYQDRIVEWMIAHGIKYWIADPTVVFWQGLVDNENDNALAAAFTTALDQVKLRAGIDELLITHHSGRLTDEVRGRGATRLEDWMDAGWYMEKDPATKQRTMWAFGRDVDVDPFELEWDGDRWAMLAGETLQEHQSAEQVAKDKELKVAFFEILQDAEGALSQSAVVRELRARGVKFEQRRLKDKLQEYCRMPGTPGPGYEQQGQRRMYFWRDKPTKKEEA